MAKPHPLLNRALVFRLTLLAAACIAPLFLAEIGLRLFRPQPLAGVMFSQDPQFGFWNRPNLAGRKFQSEPNTPYYRITTDSHGYRSTRPVNSAKALGATRILILGDSFTFGVGVNDEETYSARLEKILNTSRGSAQRYEVINAGCPGWGTENELAFWLARGPQLKPDLVILAFFRNDLSDNMRHMLFRIEKGKPVFAPRRELGRLKRITESIPFYTFLSEHSHLVNLVRRAIARQVTVVAPAPVPVPDSPTTSTQRQAAATPNAVSPELQEQLNTYSALMTAFMADARKNKTPVLLLLLPGRYDCVPKPFPDFGEVTRLGEKWADEGRLAQMLTLRNVLASAQDKGTPIFLPSDGHYTPEGHRIVAETLAREVTGLLQKPAPQK